MKGVNVTPAVSTRYRAILRALRARGDRPGFLEMGLCADLAMELESERPDGAVVKALRERLKLPEGVVT